MKLVLQRVTEGSVTIEGAVKGAIGRGFVALIGFGPDDDETVLAPMADKMLNLRVFEDGNGKMNLSLLDVGGSVLSISQFTLYADCRHGRRPSFSGAAKPDTAAQLYDEFNKIIAAKGVDVQTGEFGAEMHVKIFNDGPVTIILDSDVDLAKKGSISNDTLPFFMRFLKCTSRFFQLQSASFCSAPSGIFQFPIF